MQDSRGYEVVAGDYVVYGVRAGSWLTMNVGQVKGFENGKALVQVQLTPTKYSRIRRVSGVNMVKVNGYPTEA